MRYSITRFLVPLALVPLAAFGTPAAAQEPGGNVQASHNTFHVADLDSSTDMAAAGQLHNGTLEWSFIMDNLGAGDLTNPEITVASGHSPADFPNFEGQFPLVHSAPSLPAGERLETFALTPSTVPTAFTSGFDSERTMVPSDISSGGGQQSTTVTVTIWDPSFGGLDGDHDLLRVTVSWFEGATYVSDTDPSTSEPTTFSEEGSLGDGYHFWELEDPVVGTTYEFEVTLDVDNPTGSPQPYKPLVEVIDTPDNQGRDCPPTCTDEDDLAWCPGTSCEDTMSVMIDDDDLDGAPGDDLGESSYSVSESIDWDPILSEGYIVRYAPLPIDSFQEPVDGRMTGGGSVLTPDGTRVTHGFRLECDPTEGTNRLEVNWGMGDSFHLLGMGEAFCVEDEFVGSASPPSAGFNTHEGSGDGRLNGAPASAWWRFSDAGEPGAQDFAEIEIYDEDGATVLSVAGPLDRGDHQAHS